jgi:hypothetical protein
VKEIKRYKMILVVAIVTILCVVPFSMMPQSALEHTPIEKSISFVLTESRGTEYDSDTQATFTVTVSGNYRSGQSYFYSVHHTASITWSWPYWYDAAYTWYSDEYDVNNFTDGITDDWSDSYDYSSSPYPTTAGTYMRVRVYWGIILVGTYYLDATIYVPAK